MEQRPRSSSWGKPFALLLTWARNLIDPQVVREEQGQQAFQSDSIESPVGCVEMAGRWYAEAAPGRPRFISESAPKGQADHHRPKRIVTGNTHLHN